ERPGSAATVADVGAARVAPANGISPRPLLRRGMERDRDSDGSPALGARQAGRRATGSALRRLSIVRRRLSRKLGHRERDASTNAHRLRTGWALLERRVGRAGTRLLARKDWV